MGEQLEFDFGTDFDKKTLLLQDKNKNEKMGNKVVKVYDKELPITDIVRFGNEFVDEFLSGKKATELTINALKIVFNIISQMRNEQFQEKNKQQLSLFEEEFASEDNLFARMKIKNSLITTNTDELKRAYKLLAQYKYDYYKFTISDGSEVEALGGLIDRVLHNRTKGYTTFEISSYWMKRILQIDNYNKTLYNLVYNVRSNKHILFYFWLNKLPMEGTQIRLNTLNEYFNLSYTNAKDLCSKFLKSIRDNLNKYSHKSFNYNYLGDVITIKPYLTQYVVEEATQKEKTKEDIKKEYKLRYFKDRHQLTDAELAPLSFIYQNSPRDIKTISLAYEQFILYCRENKESATSYTGERFLEILQEKIEMEYSKTREAKHIPRCPIKVVLYKE